MENNKIGNLLFNLFTPLLLGSIIGILYRNDFSYLETLNRTIMLPPLVFGIVWSILYVLMGIWYHLYDIKEDDQKTKSVYWISLFVNLMFVPILFNMQNLALALIDVLILFAMVLYLFIVSIRKKQKFAYLLLPYLIWLIAAAFLMLDLVVNN